MAWADTHPDGRIRAKVLFWSTAAVAIVYTLVLWNLQVVRAEEFRRLSERNAVRARPVRAGRGLILDREGRLLARNRRSFDLLIDPEDLPDVNRRRTLAALGELLPELDVEDLRQRLEAAGPPWRPVLVAEDVAFPTIAWVETRRMEHPHLRVRPAHRREYPDGTVTAHLVGYIGEVTKREMKDPRLGEHRRGDLVGKAGVEAWYDRLLSGDPGTRLTVVDAIGQEIESSISEDPRIGSTLRLTIDLELQRAIAEEMGDRAGAVVVLDPRSGAVRALLSQPAFEPNRFSRRMGREEWRALLQAPGDPLHNRTVGSRFSPGSTFKILMALAALEEGVIDPSFKVTCGGGTRVHGQWRRCWKPGGHGTVDLHEAIRGSCNVYFYRVGDMLGIERISRWAHAFGFGAVTGVDLPNETSGTVPDPAWKRRTYGEAWWPGETISVAIGQGALEVTPLQQAAFAAAVANGGKIWRPYILAAVEDPARPERRMRNAPSLVRELVLDPEALQTVREGMWAVVHEPGGTARRARVENLGVCGKTGTAQVHAGSAGVDNEDMSYELRDHAWFIGFAPLEDPEVAWAVFVEHGGHGGTSAAPVARRIVETWFREDPPAQVVRVEPGTRGTGR